MSARSPNNPSSVPAFINDGLREVYGSAKANNDAVGAEVFKLPSGQAILLLIAIVK